MTPTETLESVAIVTAFIILDDVLSVIAASIFYNTGSGVEIAKNYELLVLSGLNAAFFRWE